MNTPREPHVSNDRLSSGALSVRIAQHHPMPLQAELHCQPGQLLALVGPSGAGKTSLLRCMAGLMQPTSGRVTVGSHTWLDTEARVYVPPQRRHVGLVFQDYALMPHLSALDNVALSLLPLPAAHRRAQAAQWLDHVKLGPEQQVRKPSALSGGQQQRVAVARALARSPQLLLLDEPFSAVDQMNRQGLYDLLAELRETLRIPMVLVTHDLIEARHLADQLAVMDAGHVLQTGTPAHIYASPRNARVADLVGVQNRFQGQWLGPLSANDTAQHKGWLLWLDDSGQATTLKLRVRDKGRIEVGQRVTWVVQGDGLRLANETPIQSDSHTPDDTESLALSCTVRKARNLGETTLAHVSLQENDRIGMRVSRSGPQRVHLSAHQTLVLWLDCEWVHVMPTRRA